MKFQTSVVEEEFPTVRVIEAVRTSKQRRFSIMIPYMYYTHFLSVHVYIHTFT